MELWICRYCDKTYESPIPIDQVVHHCAGKKWKVTDFVKSDKNSGHMPTGMEEAT